MARLPTPGSDDGTWGQVLNDFLDVEHNSDGTLKSSGSLAAKADDSAVVHNTGSEAVGGVKTFSASPVIPDPTNLTDAASKKYVDDVAASITAGGAAPATSSSLGLIKLTGDLGGTATVPTVPGLASKASDAVVVHNTGNENVDGVKTFTSSPIVPSGPSGSTAATSKSYVDTTASTAQTTAQTNAQTYTDTQVATSPAFILYNVGSASYANRSTATSSSTRVVIWIGPVAPSVGGNGAVDNVDVWWRTS